LICNPNTVYHCIFVCTYLPGVGFGLVLMLKDANFPKKKYSKYYVGERICVFSTRELRIENREINYVFYMRIRKVLYYM